MTGGVGFRGSAGAVLSDVTGGAASSSLRASGIWLTARLCCSALPIRGTGCFSLIRELSRLCLSVSLVVCLSASRAYAAAAGCAEDGCVGSDEAGSEEADGCDGCDEAGSPRRYKGCPPGRGGGGGGWSCCRTLAYGTELRTA